MYILDGDRNAVPATDATQWSRWFEDINHRRVDETYVGPVRVSTVFLGIDHCYGDGPPLLFETLCFTREQSVDNSMRRYSTWDEAQAGHDETVMFLRGIPEGQQMALDTAKEIK